MTYIARKQLAPILAVICGISLFIFNPITENSAVATSSYKVTSVSKFKTVKTPTYIYRQPKKYAEKAEKLQKNMGVVTTGKTKNGYSQIRYAFNYAYVKTVALQSVKANTSTKKYAWAINKKYNFKIPNYTGSNSSFKPKFYKTYSTSTAVRNFWLYPFAESTLTKTEYDTSKGLYEGVGEGSASTLVLKYPIKKNSIWTSNGVKYKILSTKATVKTAAGTFKNVVKVTDSYYVSYYAPNKGLIKVQYKDKNRYKTEMILSK